MLDLQEKLGVLIWKGLHGLFFSGGRVCT